MLTGGQIREARRLLKWRREGLVTRAKVPFSVIDRAEASDTEARITVAQEASIRRAFEAVGVEFGVGDDGSPNVLLQQGRSTIIPNGRQIREGRELVGMTQTDLAAAADVGLALVVRAELATHIPQLTRRDSAAIQGALEAAGAEFVREDGGVGVQMRKVGAPE